MQLMHNERILMETNPKGLMLTTHRVRSTRKSMAEIEVVSVMLEEVTSCAVKQSGSLALLYTCATCAIVAAISMIIPRPSGAVTGVMFGAMVLSGVLYLMSRRKLLRIDAGVRAIEWGLGTLAPNAAVEFIDAVEQAKDERSRGIRMATDSGYAI